MLSGRGFGHFIWRRGIIQCRWISGYFNEESWLRGSGTTSEKLFKQLFSGAAVKPPDFKALGPVFVENSNEEFKDYESLTQFSQIKKLDSRLLSNLERMGFDQMTPVQIYAINAQLDGIDVMACSETGSGKSHAYLIPMVNSIISTYPKEAMGYLEKHRKQCPLGLILVPSQELAAQLTFECQRLLYGTCGRVVHLGGRPMPVVAKDVRNGCHIAIATPTKLMRTVKNGELELSFCKHFVLDDLVALSHGTGTHDNLRKIVTSPEFSLPSPQNRTSMACSATGCQQADNRLLCDEVMSPNYLVLRPRLEASPVPKCISQHFAWVENPEMKVELLFEVLQKIENRKTIIFCKKRELPELEQVLDFNGYSPVTLGGSINSQARQSAIHSFQLLKTDLLLSTSTGSLGLDFRDVECIINYSMSTSVNDYIHRIGRAGRMGNPGYAISFFEAKDLRLADELVILLESCGESIPDFLCVNEKANVE